MKSPHISRIAIKNFRNFKNVDVTLSHKQLVLGENNTGKTNLIRAIQLILDPNLSERDRELQETDFNDELENPLTIGEIIEIIVEIQGYEDNKVILAQLASATVNTAPPTLRITYKYYPEKDEKDEIIKYRYVIFKGDDETLNFTYEDRKVLNILVINALRDVERDMKTLSTSPILKLLKTYDFEKEELESISESLKDATNEVLKLDEIVDLKKQITEKFTSLIGNQPNSSIELSPINIDPIRVLNTLQILVGTQFRPVSEVSLGLCNILYITLILLTIKDNTIPTFISKKDYQKLKDFDTDDLLDKVYKKTGKENYVLTSDEIEVQTRKALYDFMTSNYMSHYSSTILVIEEPEAHLHPLLQRIIYKDVMQKSDLSIILTSHSTHIASVSPLESIVHLKRLDDNTTSVKSTANLKISSKEQKDIERYIDAKRGEIFFGRGVVLVEGISEEYLIPKFAELLGKNFDNLGIVLCNINSTDFKPYVQLLRELDLPYSVITDGDYYHTTEVLKDGKPLKKRKYHEFHDEKTHKEIGYLGNEIVSKILINLGILEEKNLPKMFDKQDSIFQKEGFYIGLYTFEIEIMKTSGKQEKEILCEIYYELTPGGEKQKGNFKSEIESGDYWKCLTKIEGEEIGKGRFSQRLSTNCSKEMIPLYVENAIEDLAKKVSNIK